MSKVTPFIMRSGFLVSYKRTLPILYLWYTIFLVCSWLSGVLDSALSDVGYYAGWFLSFVLVALNKHMIGGFQKMFNIFTDEDMKYSNPPFFSNATTSSTTTHEQIKEIFTEEGYVEFKNRLRNLIFSSNEKRLCFFSAGFGILVLYLVFAYIWTYDLYLYGALVPLVFHSLRIISLVYIYALIFPIISMAWLLYSMMIGIHAINSAKLKIKDTIPIIRNPYEQWKDQFMSYTEFRERLSIVGQFLYGVSLRITAIFVIFVMADILRNWMYGYEWGSERYLIGGILVICALAVVYLSQIGLHSTLKKYRSEFAIEVHKRKFRIDLEIQRDLENPSTNDTPSYSSARFDAVTRLDGIMQELKSTSTWAIESTNTAKVFTISVIPLVTSILPLLVERFLF